ncbi:MAG: PilZ domain-containing protein [Mariprofundaceae bacterium]|nr:PilZ domain-containing protein [Mariprofundaceae bacterium]
MAAQITDRRKFIRHPVDVPIQISPEYLEGHENASMRDIGGGGLAVRTCVFYKEGTRLKVRIPHVHPPFEGAGVVCWHQTLTDQYEIGIRFLDESSASRMLMVEQTIQIEKYRKRLAAEGKVISPEDAAREWIDKYGADFGVNRS